jgi:DNA-binding MarR family transcriptional regulator
LLYQIDKKKGEFIKISTFVELKIEEEINQSKFGSASEKAIVNIIYTANFIQDAYKSALKVHGISLPQYNVLRILKGRKDNHATCGDLKDVMLDKNPDVTRLCDKLVEKKLIIRNFNKQNRRQILLKISDKGLQVLEDIRPYIDNMNVILKDVPDEDFNRLSDTLDQMREKIKS